MADPHNAIAGLQLFKFAGLPAPAYDDVSFTFAHSHGEVEYVYVNGHAHDWTGLDPLGLKVRLRFLANLDPTYFPELWNKWWEKLQDGEPQELIHPLLGKRDVVVRGGDVQLTAQVRAGVVCEVSFSTTIRDPEEELLFEPVKAKIFPLTKAIAAAVENAEVELPSQEAVTDLLDAGAKLDGFISQVDMQVQGVIAQAQGIVGGLIGALELPDKAQNQPAIDACVQLWTSLEDLGKKVGAKTRPTGNVLLRNPTTLDAFARERSMTLGEAIALNPAALLAPTVPKGTLLRFYTA